MISPPGEAARLVEDLEAAIADLEVLAKRSSPHPSRHHARDVLVPLGLLLASETAFERGRTEARLQRLVDPFREAWRRAVVEELQLACAEYVTSVDERYLVLENYDFAYTSAARERLEARLLACDCLDLEIPDGMTERIAAADEIYGPYRDRRERDGT